jgi:succinyl-diaminopimelate desuccinylase
MPNIDSIVELIVQLVQVPSRAGVDPPEPIAKVMQQWLEAHNLDCTPLMRNEKIVGLVAHVDGAQPGPCYVLNATLDTAGFGDEERWHESPTSAIIRDGWLFGRGSADSKAGVAIFSHLLAAFAQQKTQLCGRLMLLLDLDEHTGGFAGVRSYLDSLNREWPNGVYIGYPGNDRIVVGGRGFLRAVVKVRGRAAHSGSSRNHGINAVVRAANLVNTLSSLPLPTIETADPFPVPAKLTVTTCNGGKDFSMVPDACDIGVDVRLTPEFDADKAKDVLTAVINAENDSQSDCPATTIDWKPGWPAFRTDANNSLVSALQSAAFIELNKDVPLAVVGPSNIGNYLSTFGIPAISGFGATYRNLHGTDECIDLSTVAPVYRVYRSALLQLLTAAKD